MFDFNISNIVRAEFTLKDKKHLRKYNIQSQKFIDLLKLSQEKKTSILSKIVNIHLMPRFIKPDRPLKQLSPTDLIFYNMLCYFSNRGYMSRDRAIQLALNNILDKSAKSKKKRS